MTISTNPRNIWMLTAGNRLFGFLFGTVLSGSAVYSYLVAEYKASNDLLTEDIYVRRHPEKAHESTELGVSVPIVQLSTDHAGLAAVVQKLTPILEPARLRRSSHQLRQEHRGAGAREE